MALPVVAIIGRPNVGKSSLLNALAGRLISIVEPTAGVTRDRVSTIIEKNERYFELIDTGGYGILDSSRLGTHIEQQIHLAIESANLVLFMVDIRDGLMPLDQTIAKMLRKSNVEVIGVANKADNAKLFPAAAEFSRLGFGEFLPISAQNNLNKAVLMDTILEKLAPIKSTRPPEPAMKIAIVGKQNAGKSTLVNAIVGSERVIVSEIPGTTRDAVDVRVERNGKTIVVIDTAGIRKKSKITDSIDFYSYVRATRSIRRADVVLFLIDATVPISQVDKDLAGLIVEEYRSCILVVNKWDLVKGFASADDYEQYLTASLRNLPHAPIAFTTATKARNVGSVLDMAAHIFKQATTWVPTPQLNKAFEAISAEHGRSKRKAAWPKIYYATQVAVNPVTILAFVNKPELFKEDYRRHITNRLKSTLAIDEVPIRLLARSHRKRMVPDRELPK